jgi:hypothetical protein
MVSATIAPMRWVAGLVLLVLLGKAHADDAPWAAGVSEEEQQLALTIYREGNAEFELERYAQALAKYRTALSHWDHPAIRFNMTVCLINLDQPLEAFDNVERALQYGAAPVGADLFAQGQTYKKLLLAQLATIEIRCAEPDAQVTLDGQPLFTAPGSITKIVLPGRHQIVASKPGFQTTTLPLSLDAGRLTAQSVQMTALADVVPAARTITTRHRIGVSLHAVIDPQGPGGAAVAGATYGVSDQVDIGGGAIVGPHAGGFISATYFFTHGTIRPLLAVATPTFITNGSVYPGLRGAVGLEWILKLRASIVFQVGVEHYPTVPMGTVETLFAPSLGVQSRY